MIEDKLGKLIKDWDPKVRAVVIKTMAIERAYLSKNKTRFDATHRAQIMKVIEQVAREDQ